MIMNVLTLCINCKKKMTIETDYSNRNVPEVNNMEYAELVNSLGTKVMKKISEIVLAGITAGKNITQEETVEKYLNAVRQYGDEKALIALDNTLKRFKEEAKEREKRMWNMVKREVLHTRGSVPTSTRNLKDEIRNGNIKIIDLSSLSREWNERCINMKLVRLMTHRLSMVIVNVAINMFQRYLCRLKRKFIFVLIDQKV